MMAEFEGLRRRRVFPPWPACPWGSREAAAGGPPFASPHRVIDGVHRHAPDMRPPSQPALPARLTQADVHVVGVADHADGRPAGGRDRRTSPEGRVICAQLPSRAVRVALTPAERQSLAPPPGCISMLWIASPSGSSPAAGNCLPWARRPGRC